MSSNFDGGNNLGNEKESQPRDKPADAANEFSFDNLDDIEYESD